LWAALGWLGWRSLEQDRQLEAERVRGRREGATDAIAAEVRRNFADIEAQLERFSALPADELTDALTGFSLLLPDDALVVTVGAGTLQAFPRRRLLYYPRLPAAEIPYVNPLISGQAYAQLTTDPESAVEIFTALSNAADERTRAEALLGLARAQSNLGRTNAALATYAQVRQPDLLVDGRPAELLARLARCQLLAQTGRQAELLQEVQRLDTDLQSARWQLTRSAYLHYAGQARELAPAGMEAASSVKPVLFALTLAEAVHDFWADWQSDRSTTGRSSLVVNDEPVFLLWRGTTEQVVALIGGTAFLQERIIGPLRAMLDQQGLEIALEDGEGRTVLSHGTTGPDAESALRSMADTRLPWTLRIVSSAEFDDTQSAFRRRLLIGGLLLFGVVAVAGSYFSVRAVTREVEAARLKSDFVAAVSHEFRTPLTLLRQFSDLLAEGRASSEAERRRYYEALQRGTRRLTRLVEDLLDFGRMEAGSRAFTLKPILARPWLDALLLEFQEEVANKEYTIDASWNGPGDVVIDADEAALGRAVWNLLDNAVKYSPACKTVWVAGRYAKLCLAIDVRDHGLGVSEHERRAIFRKFVRGSASGRHEIKGTGLGLAMVEQIVEAHGGSVGVDSIVGEGSTFSIWLPARIEHQKTEQPA